MRLIPARAADLAVSTNEPVGAAPGPSTPVRAALVAVTAIGFVAYFVALHALIVTRAMPALMLALVLAPWGVALASAIAVKLGRGSSPSARTIAALVGVAAIVAVVWAIFRFGAHGPVQADLVLFLENLAFFGWLSSLFAASLFNGGDALVTRMARRARRGDMPPRVVRYTRHLTIAWAAFFVAAIALSTVLFIGASREAWSMFVNLLIWPLVGVAFVVEYAVRTRMLRDIAHVPFSAAFGAFRDLDRDADAGERR